MIFQPTELSGLYLIHLEPFHDSRGIFTRTFCKHELLKIGFAKEFVQINHSLNHRLGTVRGLHYQIPPSAETKLIRCIHGAVYDIVVDIRKDSPTFLQSFTVELSADNFQMILIPEGFAHGFQTLTDGAELLYHHTEFHVPECDKGLNITDPKLDIHLPLPITIISERDKSHPFLSLNFEGISL